MKVSIITVTYNRAHVIERALQSLRAQSYCDIQSVVIDGASQDDTVQRVSALQSDTDILISESDDGIYDALNKGIRLSDGDIVGVLHSDDILNDAYVIERIVKIFRSSNCDLVSGDAVFFTQRGNSKSIRRYKSVSLSKLALAWGMMPAHTATFMRRELFSEVGLYKKDFAICGDYEWFCRACAMRDLKHVVINQVVTRMEVGGRSSAGVKNTLLLNREVIRSCRENGIYTNWLMLLSKYPRKLLEYTMHR